jgi:hypothetical protein
MAESWDKSDIKLTPTPGMGMHVAAYTYLSGHVRRDQDHSWHSVRDFP